MPEGPSIVILKEAVQQFKGKTIIAADGNTKAFDLTLLEGETITDFKSWGKHFLICFPSFTIRIHLMLFGSYRINESKVTPARLSLKFEDSELNFYACTIQLLEESPDSIYDWTSDVMNEKWDPEKAFLKLRSQSQKLIVDALLDQNIFSGVGNIIKNEVLFRVYVHPLNTIADLSDDVLQQLIYEASNYSFDFLRWKKENTLKKHWLAHTKKICPRDKVAFIKEYLGKTKRRTFYCEDCQRRFN